MAVQSIGSPETRFRVVFSYLGSITAYARRRGSLDANALAAELMTIAWRRLAVPRTSGLAQSCYPNAPGTIPGK
jgi:hypothetical protein